MAQIVELTGVCQCYAWGKIGQASAVAKLSGEAIDEQKPYAELWMGTHPKGAAKIKNTGTLLSDYIDKHKSSAVGEAVYSTYGNQLPYLFKVLSVNKALSIQAHPDRELAKVLHARDPVNYPDGNHKPEMVIALSAFEGLCGFRQLSEICDFINQYSEFGDIVGKNSAEKLESVKNSSDADNQKAVLKECFENLMRTDESKGQKNLNSLLTRLEKNESSDPIEQLLLRISKQYPGDLGLFNIFFLNYITMSAGDSMFLQPNVPHAYLSGDNVEIMACSDNVVRAGLTPKFKDVETLVGMLTYEFGDAKEQVNQGKATENTFIRSYIPSISEFALDVIYSQERTEINLPLYTGGSILICTNGSATISTPTSNIQHLKEGTILFIPSNASFAITPEFNNQEFRAIRAYSDIQ